MVQYPIMILTAKMGTNADQFPDILSIYAPEGSKILDMTYGRGVFWRKVDRSKYRLITNDLVTSADIKADFRQTPFLNASFDVIVLDPPYAAHGKALKSSIDSCYKTGTIEVKSSIGVTDLYMAGIKEAQRLLKPKGILILKVQDEIESGKQVFNHVKYLSLEGWITEDLFVMVFSGIPCARWPYQRHARKNHSYFIILRRKATPKAPSASQTSICQEQADVNEQQKS